MNNGKKIAHACKKLLRRVNIVTLLIQIYLGINLKLFEQSLMTNNKKMVDQFKIFLWML